MIAKSNIYKDSRRNTEGGSNGDDHPYLKEGIKVIFGNHQGVVQVVYNEVAYVLFRNGSLKRFSLDGKYLGQYQKKEI